MKSKDLFQLAVRLLGLAFLYHGLSGLPAVLPLILSGNIIVSIPVVAWPLLVAYWLLRGAPLLIRIAYPETDGHSKSEQEDAGGTGNQKIA